MQILGTTAFGCVKLSFLFFYRRIFFTGHSDAFSKTTIAMIVSVTVWMIVFNVAFIFDCGTAFWANWGPLANDYTYCESTFGLTAAFVISDILTDVIIFCLPLASVWKLHLSIKRKLAVAGVFTFGILTVATSILRLVLFAQWYFDGTSILSDINSRQCCSMYSECIDMLQSSTLSRSSG